MRQVGAPHRQRGAILLMILLLALIAFSYGALSRLNQADLAVARGERTAAALAQAKQALIAHALLYGEGHKTNADPPGSTVEDDLTLPPGALPCPEQSFFGNEGAESGNCGSTEVSALGRLPWRSLGIAPIRDGHGECLWYAVAGTYKANFGPETLNPDSPGLLRVLDDSGNVLAGSSLANRAVAVVIAPGAPLPGQDRTSVAGTAECGGNYNAAAYLDAITVSGTAYNNAALDTTAGAVSTLVTGTRSDFNDRMLYITRDEIWGPVEKRSDFASALYDAADDGVFNNDLDDGTGTPPGGPVALAQKLAAMLARYGKNNADPDIPGIVDPRFRELPWPVPLAVADFKRRTFDDMSFIYAGRPPYRVGTSRGSTINQLVAAGCSSYECRLLTIDKADQIAWWRVAGKPLYGPNHNPPVERGQSRADSPDGWWDRWKDHFFYIVSPGFAPNSSTDWKGDPNPCNGGGSQCVRINGQRFAAAVIFAGKALPGQSRNTLAERQDPANYLEGINVIAFANPSGPGHRNLAITGNDRIVCIRAQDLAIDSTCSNGS